MNLDAIRRTWTAFEQASASPAQVLRFLMDQHGLKQSDLPEIGPQSVVSQVLAERRMLNVRQIAALSGRFGITADVFPQHPAEDLAH